MTLAVLIPTWMALIDGTVVNVGLDTIAGNLGVSIDEVSWIASIYAAACRWPDGSRRTSGANARF